MLTWGVFRFKDSEAIGQLLVVSTVVVWICFVFTAGSHVPLQPGQQVDYSFRAVFRFPFYVILYVAVPVCGWERIFFGEPEDTAVYYWMGHLVAHMIGGLFLLTRVPERWWPGRFDLIFSSHNFLHCFAILGAYMQFLGLLADIKLEYHNVSQTQVQYYTWLGSRTMLLTFAYMPICLVFLNLRELLTYKRSEPVSEKSK